MRELGLDRGAFEALAGEILGQGRTLRFRARGVSMRPFIRDGDVIEVTGREGMRLQVGTVALFEHTDGAVLAHRIVRVRNEGGERRVQMRGDGLMTPDGWVGVERILGVVTAVERNGELTRLDTGGQRLKARLWHWRCRLMRQCSRRLRWLGRMRQMAAERSGL